MADHQSCRDLHLRNRTCTELQRKKWIFEQISLPNKRNKGSLTKCKSGKEKKNAPQIRIVLQARRNQVWNPRTIVLDMGVQIVQTELHQPYLSILDTDLPDCHCCASSCHFSAMVFLSHIQLQFFSLFHERFKIWTWK